MISDLLNKYDVTVVTQESFPKEAHPLNLFPVYIINLRKDVMRRTYMQHMLNAHCINYRMVMVVPLSFNDSSQCGIDAGKLGCVLSHLWCLRQAVRHKYDRILVLEDDVVFHKEFVSRFASVLVDPLYQSSEVVMLGALDRDVRDSARSPLYAAGANVIGAHANLYSLSAASRLLSHKLSSLPVKEYDLEYSLIFRPGEVNVCMPNLVVCELSSSNLNHHFCPIKNPMNYRQTYRRFYCSSFTYTDYEYITISFLSFVKNAMLPKGSKNPDLKLESLEDAVNQFTDVHKCAWAKVPLLTSGYSWNDVVNMTF